MGRRIMEREMEELKNVRAAGVDAAMESRGAATWRRVGAKEAIL